MTRRKSALLVALLIACTALLDSPGAAQDPASLRSTLAQLVASSHLADHVGVHVVDLATGAEIYAHRADVPMNPASNMKLVTAASALLTLGAERTFRTGLYGTIDAGAVESLALVGMGDPLLDAADLTMMASALADRGVRRVGTVRVDGTYFDSEFTPPAFEQQPDEMAPFRAPVSAVPVDRNAFWMRVLPGNAAGEPAVVRLAGAGYFDLESQITTGAAGSSPNVIAIQRPEGERAALKLRGSVPQGSSGVVYRRRVEAPLAFAGHSLVDALRRVGIRCSGRVEVGAMPSGLALLAENESQPLGRILHELGKHSDNFVAEMLVKIVGAESRRPGTTARGLETSMRILREANAVTPPPTLVNGSGLFRGNLVAPVHFTRLLTRMHRDASVRAEYVSHLAIGGVDGTLANSFRDVTPARVIRAKTGTLSDTTALSGYVLGPTPERVYAFSFIANDVAGKVGEARQLGHAIATALVRELYPPSR